MKNITNFDIELHNNISKLYNYGGECMCEEMYNCNIIDETETEITYSYCLKCGGWGLE